MRRRFLTSLLTLVLSLGVGLLAAAPAQAMGILLPGTYKLLDHGDGSLGPDYGLRVDSIGAVFSVELSGASVLLDWDGSPTATISGTLRNNATLDLWTVTYTLTGVVADGGSAGFRATGGSGLLTDPLDVDTALTGEPNGGYVFLFLADGHRIAGDTTSPVGRGWILPEGTTDDWLVRAEQVPEPALMLLLGFAFAGTAVRRR